MKTLEEFKSEWGKSLGTPLSQQPYNKTELEKIFRARIKKHTNKAMQYFWASFVLQVIVYALLSHVIVKYWPDTTTLLLSMAGVALYIPFTIILMNKFKQMAVTKLVDKSDPAASLRHYTIQQYTLLQSFYRFKKLYELMLIPLSAAIGVVLVFKLYVPGGVPQHLTGALISFIITLLSCAMAIRSENKKSFEQPLRQLRNILDEFNNGAA